MDQQLASEILTGDSDEIADLKANLSTLEGFIGLIQQLDELPEINKRFWEESRSLYQATSIDREIGSLESLLSKFFGPPIKPADKALPRKLSKESTVKYLGGIQKEQSLFLLHLKTGTFYGALWPWRRNKTKIEVHLGYCSDWMVDEDYRKLETLVKRSISQNTLSQIDAQIGGQIRGISLPSFLQMAEMEQSTFTLQVSSGAKVGQLHIVNGQLMAAQTEQWTGRDAAYRIISWDDATIDISPSEEQVSDEIEQPLMHVLMESLKIKDEITGAYDAPAPPPLPRPKAAKPGKRLLRLERIPAPPKPSRRQTSVLMLVAIVLGAIVIIGGGVLFGLRQMQNRTIKTDNAILVDRLAAAESPIKKRELMEEYLKTHPSSPLMVKIQNQIEEEIQKAEDRDFDRITLQISQLPIDENYERRAISLYSEFLEKYPDSGYSQAISSSIKGIKELVDQYYYDELKRAARLDLNERLDVYRDYIKRFPEGSYQGDVAFLIKEMGNKYLDFLKSQDAQCQERQSWESCISRYDDFIANYGHSDFVEEAKQHRAALMDRRDLAQLDRLVSQAGNNYQKVYALYENYLKQHPDSSQKKTVEKEMTLLEGKIKLQQKWLSVRNYATNPNNGLFERIQHLDDFLRNNLSSPFAGEAQTLLTRLEIQLQATEQQRRQRAQELEEQARIRREKELAAQRKQRIAQLGTQTAARLAESPRYRSNGDGTVTDLATGAMWSLLDSYQELNGCIAYEAALTYVKTLRHGGHQDWRLPTAGELAALYKKKPFFPGSGAQWYWTSEAYAKGFHTVVDIVTSTPETVFERENRTQDQCGAVRAIRP